MRPQGERVVGRLHPGGHGRWHEPPPGCRLQRATRRCRAQYRKLQEALIARRNRGRASTQPEASPRALEAAIGNDPLAVMEGETHGTDADAGDYLLKSDEEE
jgi:DNA-directed RNA polymerase subunit beta'